MPCPEGTDCPEDGGSTIEVLNIEKGYWRIAADSSTIIECRIPGACVGGTDFTAEGDGYCALGYTGPLCDVVSRSFCRQCSLSDDSRALF